MIDIISSSLDQSMLLQMELFHSFSWLSNIPLCLYTTSKATLNCNCPPSSLSSFLWTPGGRERCCLWPGRRKRERELGLVEISKDHPKESEQSLFFQFLLQQGSQPYLLVFDRHTKAGRKLYSGVGGMTSFIYALIGDCCLGKGVGGQTKWGASRVIG